MSCDCHIRFGPQPPSEEEMAKEAIEWGKRFNAALMKAADEAVEEREKQRQLLLFEDEV